VKTVFARKSRVRLGFVLFYGLLLLISLVVRAHRGSLPPLEPVDKTADVLTVDGDRVSGPRVRIAYQELMPGSRRDVETILLLHGSPGHKEELGRLASILARDVRVVMPDLPGFGSSTRTVPDYSFRAHAFYVLQLLDHLGLRHVHVLGYSMGGGVALSLVDLAPERVASLTMASAIGVQEMELTGDYYANHLVHAAQLAALWVAREAIPHMGLLDRAMLGVPYARNFFDSDQRPLRGVLRGVSVPTLIVHGVDDGQVPIEAAREHYRLVPQSELLVLPGDHFLLFTNAEGVGAAVSAFVHRVAAGDATTRANADPARILFATLPLGSVPLPRLRGIAATVFAGLLMITALLSESFGSAAAGMFVVHGRVSLAVGVGSCFVSILVNTLHGNLGMPGRDRAISRSFLTSVARTALLVGAAAFVSWILFRLTPFKSMTSYVGLVVTVAIVASVVRVGVAIATDRGRRLMLSTWRRGTRWEFWPPWIFYPPVLAYVAYLMAKHRNMTVFTAANPAILAGGFIGESKFDILQGLSGTGEYVARSSLLDGTLSTAHKIRAVRRFMLDEGLTFPIVLKPNYGQRGSGVVVVRSGDALETCIRQSSVDTIVQEYVDGAEFGVFYYRYPCDPHGRIFSVTEKKLPAVVGDGQRTLEQLILHDERAICAARLYCDRHRDKLAVVPAEGEAFPLVELGTHCRGAMFLDGGWVLTPELEERFDAISRGFDGFYFGRFDVRVHGGIDAFRAGLGFKIIELNGVTSEATHIYHPGTPLMMAYRVLMRQWRIAFDIGAENRRRGVRPTSSFRLFRLTREYARTSRLHLAEHAARLSPVPELRTNGARLTRGPISRSA
jgi:pimeloyl-ACP methyl ester carboxylesterase